jgi:hypothetical protein
MKCPNCGEWMSCTKHVNVTIAMDGDDAQPNDTEPTSQLPVGDNNCTRNYSCYACGHYETR